MRCVTHAAFLGLVVVACGCADYTCADADGDGHAAAHCGGTDCADDNAAIHPGAAETCNGRDDDCDGRVDDGPGSWCTWVSAGGQTEDGETGFRFGCPVDVTGDAAPDLLVGARYNGVDATSRGSASVFDTAQRRRLWTTRSEAAFELYAQTMVALDDVDGDGSPDVLLAAPQRVLPEGGSAGWVAAVSGLTGAVLWSIRAGAGQDLGWHLANAHDGNGDGLRDAWVGEPVTGYVRLVSARDGSTLLELQDGNPMFGWMIHALPDVNGDGTPDVVVGAAASGAAGQAVILSGANGDRLRTLDSPVPMGAGFGIMVAGLPDVDGDGAGDVAVGAPYQGNPGQPAGDVFVFSGATGAQLFHWTGEQDRELYGRMVVHAGDADGDGTADLAIGAPFWTPGGDVVEAGRVEVRSLGDGHVILEKRSQARRDNLGWHMAANNGLVPGAPPGLVVSALHAEVDGVVNAGRLEVLLYGR